MLRIAAVAGVILAAALSTTPSASAGIVGLDPDGTLFYVHDEGFEDHRAHDVGLVEAGPDDYLLSDAGTDIAIVPGTPCSYPSLPSQREVLCLRRPRCSAWR